MDDFNQTAIFSIVKKNYQYIKAKYPSVVRGIVQAYEKVPSGYNYRENKANLNLEMVQKHLDTVYVNVKIFDKTLDFVK